MHKHIIIVTLFVLVVSPGFSQNELSVGAKAPSIQYQKSFPRNYTIPQNKPIVLDFWATWCGPCIAGLIETNELVSKYADRFEFIAITDTTSTRVEEFIRSRKFKHRFLIDKDTQTFSSYGISGIPHAFIIDTAGIIQWSGNGRDINEALLNELLLTGRATATKEPVWRYSYNDTSVATEIVKLVVVNKSLLNKHRTIAKPKEGAGAAQFSSSPKVEGKLTAINYSLKEFAKRVNPFFSTKTFQVDEASSQGYDFISLPFDNFEVLNAHLKKYYGICFQ